MISWEASEDMPIYEREAVYGELLASKDKEREAAEEARRNSNQR
jgi:hypothetical protein